VIADFNEHGYLPPGIHSATLDEIAVRFGSEWEVRRAQMESIRWLVDLARKAGAQRLIINGSFATEILEPNDVDCVLLPATDFPRDSARPKNSLTVYRLLISKWSRQPILRYSLNDISRRIATRFPRASWRSCYEHSKYAAVSEHAPKADHA
jgi:Family of unknown function (DUF6932)